jgi:hypothetical protein
MSEQALVRARTVHHIRIDSGRPYTQFRTDYETVVPSFDRLEAIGVVKSNAGWTAIESLSNATAIHGLVNFFTFDPSPVMKLHGNTGHAVTYLAGNIVKAERGFRIDPATFLYVPLRIVIAEGPAGNRPDQLRPSRGPIRGVRQPGTGSRKQRVHRNPGRHIEPSGARCATGARTCALAPIAIAAPSRSRERVMRQTDAGRQSSSSDDNPHPTQEGTP